MKIIILLIFSISLMFGNSEVYFQKGWSLVSVPSSLKHMEAFDNQKVELIWGFDATTQVWKGYSPDANIKAKIADKNITSLDSLQPWQAFWILSKESWSMKIKESSLESAENETIFLKKGWNLISLPQRVVVNSSFFGDALVWKYTQDSGWSVNDSTLSFPTLKDIKDSDGLWVKSKEDVEVDMGDALSKLQTFGSTDDMLEYIRSMMQANKYYYNGYYNEIDSGILTPVVMEDMNSVPTSGALSSKTSDATTTNLQEGGVDESDILKNDGKYIFSVDTAKSEIFITSFENIASKDYNPINSISTKGKNIAAMYLQDERLILISNAAYDYYIQGSEVTKASYPYYDNSQNITVDIYNVSDIYNIKELSSFTIDGNYLESRLVNKKLFLVTSFYPQINYDYPKKYVDTVCSSLDMDKVYSSCSGSVTSVPVAEPVEVVDSVVVAKRAYSCENGLDYDLYNDNSCYRYSYDEKGAWEYDYDNPIVISENLTPTISTAKKSSELLNASKMYAPIKLNQSATITSLSSFDIVDAEYKESISFVGNTHTFYASTTSFYLVSNEYPLYYDYYNYKEQQMIYKFGIGKILSYKGRGFVDGRMLNQFSMSEKDDYLRVATSSGNSWGGGQTVNSVYTLQENNASLEVKATLSGLGKEGETIKAVRFMGDRGFVVTFKETDPLYTLDMSNPLAPKVVGELSIPGFSRYLHIVDENRVLSIGRDADEESGNTLGLILQLFDITDFSKPLLAYKINIGDVNTYSSAEYNHKAFIYRTSDNLFALPYTQYDYSSSYSQTNNFGIYKVDGMKILELKTLGESASNNYWYSDERGVIFDFDGVSYGAVFDGSNILSDVIMEEK